MDEIEQKCFTENLLEWFAQNARILPWREEPAPYRVWISEIMLQQTRVAAVMPYFERFMNRLPDIRSLAEVDEEQLLKLWEGLGYYNRARNLKKAAQEIMERYHGTMPQEYEALLGLSGIGPYTAGAITSIAFNKPYVAVDGNVIRVFSRIMMEEGLVNEPAVKNRIDEIAMQCLPKEHPGAYNQALMELGATVCLPNGAPKCEECPVRSLCQAFEQGRQLDYPRKAAKAARKIVDKTILVIQDAERLAIQKRPDKGLLAGMYEFPSIDGICSEDEVLAYISQLGFQPLHIRRLCDSKHIFTHREWHMTGYAVRVDELAARKESKASDQMIFIDPSETADRYPIPSAFYAYTQYFDIRLGNARYNEKENPLL